MPNNYHFLHCIKIWIYSRKPLNILKQQNNKDGEEKNKLTSP
jgi:hypothetical protein